MDEAYCGPAPTPASLLASWNLDAVAIVLCVGLVAAHVARRESGRLPLGAAVALLLILFVSPLCALTTALFSARVVHHVLLIAVVAPLLAVAFSGRAGPRLPLAWATGLHAAVLWFWHVPDVYSAAIADALPYWAMQVSLLGTGWLFWRQVILSDIGPALLVLLATVVQMGLLGALLTFAGEPLYEPHFMTTRAFGLSPLEDQQLGGLIMWVPAAAPYLLAALVMLSRLLSGGVSARGAASRP